MARERSHIKVYVCEKPPQNHEINNPTAYPRAFFRILTKSISTEDITAERDIRSPTICTFASDACPDLGMFDGHIPMNILNCRSDLTDRKTHICVLTYYILVSFLMCTLPSRFLLLVPTESGDAAFVATVEYLSVADGRQWARSLLSFRLESIHTPPSSFRSTPTLWSG